MKANQLVLALLFLALGIAVAQQPASPTGTNAPSGVSNLAKDGITNGSNLNIAAIRHDAEQGKPNAQNNLGWIYLTGDGLAKDEVEGVKWLTKASENGNLQAANRLGLYYLTGENKNKVQEGIRWVRFAAEHGDVSAQTSLALFLRQGGIPGVFEVEKDLKEAAKWYSRAARQGDSDAQFNIGEMYSQGKGVVQDFVEAYKWFNIAATSTNLPLKNYLAATREMTADQNTFLSETTADRARQARNELTQQMTPDQIAEAQGLSRAFKPRKEGSDSSALLKNPTASGTGFFITDDGYLISNYHVVKDATKVRLRTSAGLIDAKVVQVDAANDLALLKADGRFAPLPIAASRTVNLGGTVATVGFPDIGLQGFAPKFARGEIASLSGASDDPRYFQTSVPVQPGNSGGALVDEHGNVVGVVSAKLDASVALAASGALPENVNYAVKSSLLLSFLESVPDVANKLKAPVTAERKFEDVVKSAQDAAALVLVY